ncbi:ESPR domain-containing protein, partial [Escherichia coli]
MKRHLNTSYRLVWNHITGTLVVASELARSRGKRAGVAVALSLAAVTPVPALAADTVVEAGGHCCKVSDEAAFCLIQRPYISKTLLTRRISPRG